MMNSKDRLIPWLFVLGFLIVFGANAIMVTFALDSFPGVIDGYHQTSAMESDDG